MMGNDYDEINISQVPALEVLNNLGYKIIKQEDTERMRGSPYNVILKPILLDRLKTINSYEYLGNNYKFTEKNLLQAIQDINEPLTDGLIKTNEKIYDLLLLGKSYPEYIDYVGGTRSFNINYIDWNHPENNVFHAVEEYIVEKADGNGTIRPDIVLFVNGIPFAVIECKKSSISINQGISQMIRNQGQEYIPQLFKFVQIVLATNKNGTKYATVGTIPKFWNIWNEDEYSSEFDFFNNNLTQVVIDRIPTKQDENIVSLFHPKRVLDIIRYFILFDMHEKKIARYQQYFAVKEAIKVISEKDSNGKRKSGVIWHTQGSGKSLTMVMLAKYILYELSYLHPQVVVVTDRIELDSQIHKTFTHTRLKADRATSGKNLIELINGKSTDVITTLVNKFDMASRTQEPILSNDVFIMVDESHRTQYGEMHIKMRKVFPNACYLGFTGTPLMKKEKSTMKRFGSLIHKYTITDGVEDKTIVPLLYEGRYVEQTVNRVAIDKRIEMITRNMDKKLAELLKKKWSNFEAIASSEQRIRLIADDIYVHFSQFYKDTPFKAMLATNSKFDAIRYQEAFEEYDDIKTAVIMSPPDDREGYEEIDQEPKDRVIKYWNKMIEGYDNPIKYEERIKNEFVHGDEIDILIVIDKLLTGFDAPRASVMYIDKPLKEHSLLQAIARVNRLYDGKDYGLIVDYRGLIKELDSALQTYSGAGLENYDKEDLKGALVDVIFILGKLRESYSHLLDIFRTVKNQNDNEEYELILANDSVRKNFYNQLSLFGRYLGIALESEHVYYALNEVELRTYKNHFKFFQELRASVKLRYSDTLDNKEYESKMRNLMDTYIAAEDVIIISKPVDILSEKEFEEELDKLGSKRAKADAIATRLTKSIYQKYNENPAFYNRFSERIEEIIQQYKEQRISDADYYLRMEEVKMNYRKGYSGEHYPRSIKNNSNCQAFYGVLKNQLVSFLNIEKENNDDFNEMIAEISIEVNSIIDKNSKIDWHDNLDVHKKITSELNDMFFMIRKKKIKSLSFSLIDQIINDIKTVALRRY